MRRSLLQVLTRPHEVAQSLLGGHRHAHRRELAGAVQAGEVARVGPVGLDAHPGAPRDQRGGDHVAGNAQRADQPLGIVTGRPGLIARPEHRSVRVTSKELAHRLGGVGDHPLVAGRRAGSQHGHRDGVFVHVQSYVCKLVHGRSFRVSAPRSESRG